jgi:hypothetical protein
VAVSTIGRRIRTNPFKRQERAMQRFRIPKTLQKFSSVHAQVHNQFNQERHLLTGGFTNSDALPHWQSGAPLRRKLSCERGHAPYESTNHRFLTTPP